MKIATYNINNVNRRLPNLVAWLKRARPDIVCLQELKAADEAFPQAELRKAGYHALWRGQKTWNGVAILSRKPPILTRKALPGDPDDAQSRYIEAAIDGLLVGCLYLPNGNPQPGPKFKYKLDWFRRLQAHASKLLKSGAPVVLAGDYNAVPTDFDIYSMNSWKDDALVQPADSGGLCQAGRPGLDRFAPNAVPRQADVHLLGLQAAALGARRRPAPRPSSAVTLARCPPEERRRRSRGARLARAPATTHRPGSS